MIPNVGVYLDLIYTLSLAIIYMHLNWQVKSLQRYFKVLKYDAINFLDNI
jgi:hypothetical protein